MDADGGRPRPGEWDGRFWPTEPFRTGRAFDHIRLPYLAPLRHLPTTAKLMRAAMAFGPSSHALLARWHAAWKEAVGDVDAFHAASPLAAPGDARDPVREAALMLPERPDLAAAVLAAAGAPRLCQREEVFHVLEDARVVTELLGCGMPFALVGAPMSLIPLVAAGDGRGGLRHVRWDGEPADQDFHAMAARRTRALQAAVNPYWESGAFRRAAGREMALARGAGHLSAMLRDMAAAGHRKAFLKAAAQKRGTWVVDLAGVTDARGGALAAHAAMGEAYGLLHEGLADGRADVLVQAFSPFSHEHRFLVVDHRIVASTPSDRALSVLDALPGRILHPGAARLLRPAEEAGAYDRGGSQTVEAPDLVAAMARSARTLVRALRAEGMLPGCYCLDMGLTSRGVLPIEINTLVYCGLYAVDWSRVAGALARRPRPAAPAGPGRVRGQRTDALEDAVEFLLDMLSDEPPRRLREVAERLLAEGERAEEALRKGREARERREAVESLPPAPEDLGALAGMARSLDEAAR